MSDELGVRLRARREELGLYQSAVAQAIGVMQSTVSNWERGVSDPSVNNLLALCDILNIDVAHIREEALQLLTPTERAIAQDTALTRRDRSVLLATYAAMTRRESTAPLTARLEDSEDSEEDPG